MDDKVTKMTKKYYNELGDINYLQVLKTAVLLSFLLMFYLFISSSITFPWLITYYILGFLVLLISAAMLHNTIIEVKKILQSLILKLHEKYTISMTNRDNLCIDYQKNIIFVPFYLKRLCVFRC